MSRQFVVILVVVLPDLVDLELAVLLQVKLHLHIVLVREVGELDRHGQIVPIEVFIADAFHDITHVEVHLAHDRKQQPGRLHGVQFIVNVRRATQPHQSAEFAQTAHLTHQSAKGTIIPHEQLSLLRVFRWCDDEICCCQHQHHCH